MSWWKLWLKLKEKMYRNLLAILAFFLLAGGIDSATKKAWSPFGRDPSNRIRKHQNINLAEHQQNNNKNEKQRSWIDPERFQQIFGRSSEGRIRHHSDFSLGGDQSDRETPLNPETVKVSVEVGDGPSISFYAYKGFDFEEKCRKFLGYSERDENLDVCQVCHSDPTRSDSNVCDSLASNTVSFMYVGNKNVTFLDANSELSFDRIVFFAPDREMQNYNLLAEGTHQNLINQDVSGSVRMPITILLTWSSSKPITAQTYLRDREYSNFHGHMLIVKTTLATLHIGTSQEDGNKIIDKVMKYGEKMYRRSLIKTENGLELPFVENISTDRSN